MAEKAERPALPPLIPLPFKARPGEPDRGPASEPKPTGSQPRRENETGSGLSSFATVLGLTVEPLPPKACPECGETMDQGYQQGSARVYLHLRDCPALEARIREEDARRQVQLRQRLAREWANFPDRLPLDLNGWERTADAQTGIPFLNAETREGYAYCRAFAAAWKREEPPRDGLTLTGPYGTGKTTLLVALGRTLTQQGIRVRFETAPMLYNRLLHAMWDDVLDHELQRLIRVPVLLLDDLCREKPTPWWVDQVLWPIVDGRYTTGRPMVITSNKSWSEMELRYAGARNERECADSAGSLIDRLQSRAASIPFGSQSNRVAGWDFLNPEGGEGA